MTDTQDLLRLADEVAACTEPTRELADRVLLACGWRLNHDDADIAAWRTDPGTVEGEDGKDYPVTLEDRMTWACWYKPGNRPFRDSWIDGHYRPNPLASLDAAMSLVPPDHTVQLSDWDHPILREKGPWQAIVLPLGARGAMQQFTFTNRCDHAATAAAALTAASLRARAHSTKETSNG